MKASKTTVQWPTGTPSPLREDPWSYINDNEKGTRRDSTEMPRRINDNRTIGAEPTASNKAEAVPPGKDQATKPPNPPGGRKITHSSKYNRAAGPRGSKATVQTGRRREELPPGTPMTSLCLPIHTQNTASAPSHPIQHPTAGESTPLTPMGLVMAGCWQINSILTNIGRRNSIRILN